MIIKSCLHEKRCGLNNSIGLFYSFFAASHGSFLGSAAESSICCRGDGDGPFSFPTVTHWMSECKISICDVTSLSETGARMCEAAASRTDDVEMVGVSEMDADAASETGSERVGTDRELVETSADKGMGWAMDIGMENGRGMADASREMTRVSASSVVTIGWICVPGVMSVWMTVISPELPWLTSVMAPWVVHSGGRGTVPAGTKIESVWALPELSTASLPSSATEASVTPSCTEAAAWLFLVAVFFSLPPAAFSTFPLVGTLAFLSSTLPSSTTR